MYTEKRTLALDPPKLCGSGQSIRYPAIAEIKVDGEFCFLYFNTNGDPTHTINKNGFCRFDFDQLNAIEDRLAESEYTDGIFLCELYWGDGKNGQLYELLSHKLDNDVKITIHDIYMLNNEIIKQLPLITRKELLFHLFDQEWQPNFGIVTNGMDIINNNP